MMVKFSKELVFLLSCVEDGGISGQRAFVFS